MSAVNVGLTVSVEARLDESVATLKRRAQIALAVRTGRLLNSGGLLDDGLTVEQAKLDTGTSLTLELWNCGGSTSKPLAVLLQLS